MRRFLSRHGLHSQCRVAVCCGLLAAASMFVVGATPSPGAIGVGLSQLSNVSSVPVEGDEHMWVLSEDSRNVPSVAEAISYRSGDGRWAVDVSGYDKVTLELKTWPVDELMFLLEGELEIRDCTGVSRVYKAGDAFLMPQGFCGTWQQRTGIKKVAVSYSPLRDANSHKEIHLLGVSIGAVKSRPLVAMSDWKPYLTVQHAGRFVAVQVYQSSDNLMRVQAKRFEAMKITLKSWPIDEFFHIVQGEVTLRTPDGAVTDYGPGSNFLLPKGFSGEWEQKATLEMITAEYGPSP